MGKDVVLSISGLVLSLAIVFYLGSDANRATQNNIECADIFFSGGTIWTGTEQKAEAVSVKGKSILSVGTYEEVIKTYCPSHTVAVPLEGKMMTPGWIDSHVHSILVSFNLSFIEVNKQIKTFSQSGLDLLSVQISDVDSHTMLADRVKEFIDTMEPGEWLVGSGWNQERFKGEEAGTSPHRLTIDKVSPNNPVWLCRLDLHQCLANTLALEKAGVDLANPPEVLGGVFQMGDDGLVTGIVKDNAMAVIVKAVPHITSDRYLEGLQTAMNYFVSNGVTSINQVVNDIFTDLEDGWTTFEELYLSSLPGKFNFDGTRSLHASPFVRTYFAPALALYKDAAELHESKKVCFHFFKILLVIEEIFLQNIFSTKEFFVLSQRQLMFLITNLLHLIIIN